MNLVSTITLNGFDTVEKLILYGLVVTVALMVVMVFYVALVSEPAKEAELLLVSAELANDNCAELKEYLKDNLDELSEAQITKAYVKLEITC